ncbi:MAG: glycosyltransferase [Pyrinomonadaceae bacterium]|nr:glycosyltransferase [Pyrinomonadaceae bacterium]MBP6213380.1 glycosyltransferase [Pyrinomonadaceae bacterium]
MASTLYICYFGLREPLVQTQVLPYLREIRKDGIDVSILTFEPHIRSTWSPEQIAEERAALATEGIDWHCLVYHKWPSVPATVYDIFRGTLFIRNFIAKNQPDVLHGRVHLPTLMGAIARKLSRHKPKLLFDIRGFFPEEYTDAGIWPEGGWLYRAVKRIERWLMSESDGFVVLTENARNILFPESTKSGYDDLGRPVEVIPCCVDFGTRFKENTVELRSSVRTEIGIDDRFVIVHLGALGGLYRTNEIADFLAVARKTNPRTFAMFLTQTDPTRILPLLKERGFDESDYFVGRVAPADIQSYLNASDIGLSFVKAGYATASRSPTKIPEYLACGLPVIANRGVGDVDDLISRNRVGALIDHFSDTSYLKALDMVDALGDVRGRCRETAEREFSLTSVGGVKYRALYHRLLRGE